MGLWFINPVVDQYLWSLFHYNLNRLHCVQRTCTINTIFSPMPCNKVLECGPCLASIEILGCFHCCWGNYLIASYKNTTVNESWYDGIVLPVQQGPPPINVRCFESNDSRPFLRCTLDHFTCASWLETWEKRTYSNLLKKWTALYSGLCETLGRVLHRVEKGIFCDGW